MNKSLANKVLTPQFRAELTRLIGPHNRKAHDRTGGIRRDCSTATRSDREAILLQLFAELSQLGFKLKTPAGLREKHVRAVATYWEGKALAPSTKHKRMSTLRVFASWIGKHGMVGDIENYFEDPASLKRSMVVKQSKTWEDNGVDVVAVIHQATEIDDRFGLYLALQHNFGLRVKEAIQLRPRHSACDEYKVLEVFSGSKGGRPRLIPIETPEQEEVVAWARRVSLESNTGSIRWPGRTWKRAQTRFYNLMKKIKATKAGLGVTAHGLRHGDANRAIEKATGQLSPIHTTQPSQIDPETYRAAALKVTSRLGHGRTDVLGYYVGSHGHALRKNKRPPAEDALETATASEEPEDLS